MVEEGKPQEFWRWPETSWVNPGIDWKNGKVITAGVDVGSVSTQAVIMVGGELFAFGNTRTGSDSPNSAKKGMDFAFDSEFARQDQFRLMTVHKSKGLQARVVFLLDMVKGLYGFPCEIENPDIFDPAILGRKRDRLEEERRLFYVAATRAKEDLKIYTMDTGRSEFLEEVSPHLTVYEM